MERKEGYQGRKPKKEGYQGRKEGRKDGKGGREETSSQHPRSPGAAHGP
jgi:hypothetical protein